MAEQIGLRGTVVGHGTTGVGCHNAKLCGAGDSVTHRCAVLSELCAT
jgi:hypothetical protein